MTVRKQVFLRAVPLKESYVNKDCWQWELSVAVSYSLAEQTQSRRGLRGPRAEIYNKVIWMKVGDTGQGKDS